MTPQQNNTRKPFHLFGFFGVFFIATGLIMLTSDMPAFSIPINTFQKDYFLLREYKGGLIASDKFKENNIVYGNIFGFHEMARTSDGLIVPYRSVWRVFLKAPIFLLSGSDIFPLIWRISGLIIWIGIFIVLIGKSSSHIKTLVFLSCVFFAPIQLFDQEFIFLYAQAMMLFLYFTKHKNGYLLLYFIFWIYAISARIEFIYFSSLINLYLALHWLRRKKYSKLLLIATIYILFAAGYLLSNNNYYGGYLTNSYDASLGEQQITRNEYGQASVKQQNILSQSLNRLMKVGFPSWLNMGRATIAVVYIMQSYIWIGCIIFLFKKPKITSNRIFLRSKKFSTFLMLIVLYAFIFYGSKGVANMPIGSGKFFYNIWNSSYARYFWVFIFLIWSLLYSGLFIPGRLTKLLFATWIIIFIFQWPYYFNTLKIYPARSNAILETRIPPGSTILARIPPIRLMFTNYQILFPWPDDYWEYVIYISAWSAAWLAVWNGDTKKSNPYLDRLDYFPKNYSAFLEKIGYYIYTTKKPVYILTDTYTSSIEKEKTLNFFKSKQGLILENYKNNIVIIRVDNNFTGEYKYASGV